LLAVLDPGMKILLPNRKRLTPANVAGHVIALAGRVSACLQTFARARGKALEVVFDAGLARAFVRVNQSVVLVGLKGLFEATLTAERDPRVWNGRSTEFALDHL